MIAVLGGGHEQPHHCCGRNVRQGGEIACEPERIRNCSQRDASAGCDGRTPNTNGISLELAAVQTTDHGYIKVNERLETTSSGVWAAGDCAGSPHFTHIAENDYQIVRDNILGGQRVTTGRQVPFCIFTDPEFARIGSIASEAKGCGTPYRLAKIPMSTVFRARTLSETLGVPSYPAR